MTKWWYIMIQAHYAWKAQAWEGRSTSPFFKILSSDQRNCRYVVYVPFFNNLHNTIYESHIKKSENRDTYVMINT
jgi:hypothetical protein